MTFTVIGTPGPQGSKRHVGRGIMVESSKLVKPWREAVKMAAREEMARLGLTAPAISGPVLMQVKFFLPRPKSAKVGAVPASRPDLSKLLRSTEDAMTEAGVWEDDGRVIDCHPVKLYTGDGLDVPGAIIHVRRLYAVSMGVFCT